MKLSFAALAMSLTLITALQSAKADVVSTRIDAEAATVLVLGTSAKNIAALMKGANTLEVTRRSAGTASSYTFTSRKCESGIAFVCNDVSSLMIIASVSQDERREVTYKSSNVISVSGTPAPMPTPMATPMPTPAPQFTTCVKTINCMPPVSDRAASLCSDAYAKWSEQNCGGAPERLD